MNELEKIQNNELVGEPEQNSRLVFLENTIEGTMFATMLALKEINDMGLYTCRGYKSMREYIAGHTAKVLPFSISFNQSLLKLADKLQISNFKSEIEQEKIKEFIKIAKDKDVVSIPGEGRVSIQTETGIEEISLDEYNARMMKQFDEGIIGSKKELTNKTKNLESENKILKKKLEELGSKVDEFDEREAVIAKQYSLNKNDIGFIVTKAKLFSPDTNKEVSHSKEILHGYTLQLNLLNDETKADTEIAMRVADYIQFLKTQRELLLNSWAPFLVNLDEDVNFGDIGEIDESKLSAPKQLPANPPLKPNSTADILYTAALLVEKIGNKAEFNEDELGEIEKLSSLIFDNLDETNPVEVTIRNILMNNGNNELSYVASELADYLKTSEVKDAA